MPDDTTHDDGLFGERVAATYDSSTDEEFSAAEIAATIDVLAELAGDGPALELAIGTGRVALPLAARGVTVAGIDLSRAMVARLREKPGGADMDVAIGDMATTRVNGEFSLVYLVFNTIGNVVTQEAQVQCFENAARHLRPGGRFVIEVGVPELQNLPVGQTIIPFRAAPDGLSFDVYDVVTQRATSQHYVFTPDGRVQSFPLAYRYVWPSELDLMARIAGLALEARWADWQREPFTATSRSHVSVWAKP